MNNLWERLKQVTRAMPMKRPEPVPVLNYGPERAGKTTIGSFEREATSADDRTDRALKILNTRLRRIDQRGG